MSTFIFWNKQNTGCDTYEELLTLERDGYSHSSCVTLDDPEEVVDCVLNETNADLGYHRYSLAKAVPLPNLTNCINESNNDVNGCIIGDRVYQAMPSNDNNCDGCEFTAHGMPEHCIKVACTVGQRDDERDVIWTEKVNHYNGHEVSE